MPLPHTPPVHEPFWQVWPDVPHVMPFCPVSATDWQVWLAVHWNFWQAAGAPQSVAALTQLYVQSLSQPSPFVWLPSSQVSPSSRIPFVHTGCVHTPALQ
jgi:hypothetical protein